MRKFVRYAVCVLGVLALLAVATGVVLYRAAQREPEFYRQALRVEPARHEEAGDELEKHVLELHNDVRDAGAWEAVFTEEEINGWLAADLPEKFPNVLPKGTQEPRVAIDSDAVRIACRFDNGKLKTVISLALSLDLTQETNTLAVRVDKLRAGVLPVPLKQFIDRITVAAGKGNIPVKWSQEGGDPIALVTLPTQHEDYAHREVYLDLIELRDGAVYLAGHTQRDFQRTASIDSGSGQSVASSTIQR